MISRLMDMVFSSSVEIAEHVSRCLELAILLEVSAHPKPGNVHRTADFRETRYEHFLASAVAVAPHFKHTAERSKSRHHGRSQKEPWTTPGVRAIASRKGVEGKNVTVPTEQGTPPNEDGPS